MWMGRWPVKVGFWILPWQRGNLLVKNMPNNAWLDPVFSAHHAPATSGTEAIRSEDPSWELFTDVQSGLRSPHLKAERKSTKSLYLGRSPLLATSMARRILHRLAGRMSECMKVFVEP
ncbi:unnamed protein product [Durusdinium trenchii]|uniref:Uncharacterized protein n=1 Tax=Durusdinium trenchii TaxID=1381693 RepID=A0ABP0KXR5_9DINO